ncbi:hypothetical protein [Galactobacter valiniphilus]|uniref:hypothetical protein n=1 Tax=Galactobacter valiniphilus TaxID=2676122 RepID=UPI0013146408|nr:hypothetical protein [Galactobacter valiniphilus]
MSDDDTGDSTAPAVIFTEGQWRAFSEAVEDASPAEAERLMAEAERRSRRAR